MVLTTDGLGAARPSKTAGAMTPAATRRCVCPGNEATAESYIPLHLLLDILARSDMATIVRFAATSKPIRRAIAGPEFRHAVAHRAAGGGFDPAALLGFSYSCPDWDKGYPPYNHPPRVGQTRRQKLRFDADLLRTFKPVAVRGGLVVLRRRTEGGLGRDFDAPSELRVCKSLTGDTILLPPSAVLDIYPPALLKVGDAGSSFELLVADWCLRKTQTFSSRDGKWGAVVETHAPPDQLYYVPGNCCSDNPVILGGGVIHWLWGTPDDPCVGVLDVSTKQTRQIKLPPDCRRRMYCMQDPDTGLLLATAADGSRLGLLVSEMQTIVMWTLEEEEDPTRWTRQVVILRDAICREAMASPSYSVCFQGFGERSGAVIIYMEGIGLVQLNLGSKEVVVFGGHGFKPAPNKDLFSLCLHETDLSYLLQAMKTF